MRYIGLVFLITALAGAFFFSCDRMSKRPPTLDDNAEDGGALGGGVEDDA